MFQLFQITYTCYPHCKTGTKNPVELVRCELFGDTKGVPGEKYTCSDEEGGNGKGLLLQRLRLRQRCPSCVREAVAERVMERKEREERERNAESRGERGEVLRQLRLEEDEEDEVTPRVGQYQFASASVRVRGQDSGEKVNFDVEAELTTEMEDELKDGVSPEDMAHRPASVTVTPTSSPMSMFLSDIQEVEEGPPKALTESEGDFGLGIYFQAQGSEDNDRTMSF